MDHKNDKTPFDFSYEPPDNTQTFKQEELDAITQVTGDLCLFRHAESLMTDPVLTKEEKEKNIRAFAQLLFQNGLCSKMAMDKSISKVTYSPSIPVNTKILDFIDANKDIFSTCVKMTEDISYLPTRINYPVKATIQRIEDLGAKNRFLKKPLF